MRKSSYSSHNKTARQVRRIDEAAINRYGIPSMLLMERAGHAVAEEALLSVKKIRPASAKAKVTIFCGKGNNSGDGLVCARHLLSAGVDVQVYLLCNKSELKGDAFYNALALNTRKIRFREISGMTKLIVLKKSLKADIIIDAIFGTGFHGSPGPFFERVIKIINQSPAYKIAVDVPSGLDATTGIVKGSAVVADKTVTMGFAKTGFYKNDGPDFCGTIKVVDIGLRGN
jgi:ADP-dependent NAD(P)H-hydrate dehydratase / NAD(P)H-hydrate epimerase